MPNGQEGSEAKQASEQILLVQNFPCRACANVQIAAEEGHEEIHQPHAAANEPQMRTFLTHERPLVDPIILLSPPCTIVVSIFFSIVPELH